MAGRAKLALAVAAAAALYALAEARAVKPKVPPGRDPGGVAVALIGGGLDYRRPDIAARLARDGEGEPVAWDFDDDDARPFSGSDDDGPVAALLTSEAQAVRLVAIRVAGSRHDRIAAALRFAGATPARIALVLADPGTPLPLAGLAEAARRLSGLLVLVPARHVVSAPDNVPAMDDRAGLLLVSADGKAGIADVAAPVPPAGAPAEKPNPEDAATVRVAALAARLVAAEPLLSGAALRARILSLAEPQPAGPPVIPDVARLLSPK